MNQYEKKDFLPHFTKFKCLNNSIYLTKDMLDDFLQKDIIKMYELNLRARRQSKKLFTITDSEIKMIITETYLNILKQIDRGKKPVIANKIKEFFGMSTYNQMIYVVKQKVKWSITYIDMVDIDTVDETDESVKDKGLQQERNHQLYLEVMTIAQSTLTKLELDCFVFKYYSNYTHKEIKELLNISNINKVSIIIHSAETKLKEATKNIKI